MFKNKIYNKILYTIFMIFIAMIIGSNTAFAEENVKIDLNKVTITIRNPSIEYKGTAWSPSRTVKYNGKQLREGVDFKVTYNRERINVGTVKMTFTGIGNFTGSVTKEFEIKRADLSTNKAIKISNFRASCAYTGSEIRQEIVLKNGSKTMTQGTDYILSFTNNKEVGTAYIIIKGQGNYTGTLTKKFKIIKANISNFDLSYPKELNYTGKAVEPKVTLSNKGTILQEGRDFKISYFYNVKAGNSSFRITGQGNYTGVIINNFTINKVEINNDEALEFRLRLL